MKPKCYMMVGVPGSGKSTWIGQMNIPNTEIISSDDIIENIARARGLAYTDVFSESIGKATLLMEEKVAAAVAQKRDIIWDQTSTTVASRARKFKFLSDYHVIAVVFRTPEPDDLTLRLAARPDKQIPRDVVQCMIDQFQPPSFAEGFDEIWL